MVAIGIDLGTTYSCVAVWRHGTVEVIANDQGNRTTPSVVSFTDTDTYVGESARNLAPINPMNTVFSAKRLIGRRYDDECVQQDLRQFPFQVVNDDGKPRVRVEFKGEIKKYAAEELGCMVLFRMKLTAEAYLGTPVTDAVITVPAYFNDAQRQATRTAGKLAGFNVLRILNEPTAAALAYGLDRDLKGDKRVLIYDLGGGTFDVSVLIIGEGSVYEVKATAGNPRLGGEDFDGRLVSHFVDDFRNKYGLSLPLNSKAWRRLRTASEKAKTELTSSTEATVELEMLYNGIDYSGKISRALFEDLCSDLFQATLKPVEQVLSDAKMTKDNINEIILVGGSTRIPKVRSMLREYFGKPLTVSLNPDEAVAYGAAIQAAILSGEHHEKIQDWLLVDVVPLSLGVEAARGIMLKVIEKNTAIPCSCTQNLTTLEDYQRAMTIEIFEGERSLTKDNNLLGFFDLDDIPPAPRGVAKIDVTFNVDANGILNVSAKDRCTGNTKSLTISNDHRLKEHEIRDMIANAEIFKEQDRESRMRLVARNELETYIYSVKHAVLDEGGRFTEDIKEVMLQECADALEWLDTNLDCVKADYQRKLIKLTRCWNRIMSVFYGHEWQSGTKRQRGADKPETESDDLPSPTKMNKKN